MLNRIRCHAQAMLVSSSEYSRKLSNALNKLRSFESHWHTLEAVEEDSVQWTCIVAGTYSVRRLLAIDYCLSVSFNHGEMRLHRMRLLLKQHTSAAAGWS